MTLFKARCPVWHPDRQSRCGREEGHNGAHRNFTQEEWDDALDDMDGGVTAAQIEKEAERDAARDMAALWKETAREHVKRSRTALTWGQMCDTTLVSTLARAEKAEQRRDEWCEASELWEKRAYRAENRVTRLRRALDLPDTATTDDMVARIEEINRHDCVRDTAVIEKRVSFTAEDVDDAMVGRFRTHMWEVHDADLDPGDAVEALRAALTPEPQRPEGAEELGELIGTWTASEVAPAQVPTGLVTGLADFLATNGVHIDRSGR